MAATLTFSNNVALNTVSIKTREELGALLQRDQHDPRIVVLMQEMRARKAANGTTAAVALDEILQERRDIADKVSRPYTPKLPFIPRIVFLEGHIFQELALLCGSMAVAGTLGIAAMIHLRFPWVPYMEILRALLHLN